MNVMKKFFYVHRFLLARYYRYLWWRRKGYWYYDDELEKMTRIMKRKRLCRWSCDMPETHEELDSENDDEDDGDL